MKNLLMIPAMGSGAGLYEPVLPGIADLVKCSILIADRDNLADCVGQILQDAPDKFIVLGTSLGGRVALEMTLAAPDRIEGLVIVGASAGPVADAAAGHQRTQRLLRGEFDAVVTEMADKISHLPGPHGRKARDAFIGMAQQHGPELMARQSQALAERRDLWPRLAAISCPALMLWGRHDQFSPASDGLRMAQAIPQARYVEIADCGHFPSLEAPEEFTASLIHWLQDAKLCATSG